MSYWTLADEILIQHLRERLAAVEAENKALVAALDGATHTYGEWRSSNGVSLYQICWCQQPVEAPIHQTRAVIRAALSGEGDEDEL